MNKSWCVKVCQTLLMHWLAYFVSKRSSWWCASSPVFSMQRSSAVYGSGAVVEPIHSWGLGYPPPRPCKWTRWSSYYFWSDSGTYSRQCLFWRRL